MSFFIKKRLKIVYTAWNIIPYCSFYWYTHNLSVKNYVNAKNISLNCYLTKYFDNSSGSH